MALWKNGAFVEDTWREIAEGEDVPPAGHVILTLEWWEQEREAFAGSNAPLGLRILPGAPLATFVEEMNRFALIELVFPKFGDGRPFSMARLLRERHGFTGELRAAGDVLIDQIQMMARCGFDTFQISDPTTERLLRERGSPIYTRFYQPGATPEAPVDTRPWARRPG